jgi:subtilisin family serine protease
MLGHNIVGAAFDSNTSSAILSGTSMAAPHVTGVVALFMAQYNLSPADVKRVLMNTATKGVISGTPSRTVNALVFNNFDNSIPISQAAEAKPFMMLIVVLVLSSLIVM